MSGEQFHEQDDERAATPEQSRILRPRVYVASLRDYVEGVLHGAWIDADREEDELQAEVAAMLSQSPRPGAEEWAIHDYTGFGAVQLSEYENLATISRLGLGIREHGLAFGAWASLAGTEAECLAEFEEAYLGQWESVEGYAEQLLDDLGATEVLDALPGWLKPYVSLNTEGFARDMVLGGDLQVVESQGSVWIFEGHL